ncbi:MAG TPA: cupin domain-containing protein [Myxococcaceae bacterium]|nr:cupin domain-containing protein [Myxococcaceae bacterium]
MSFQANILQRTRENPNFRRVEFTGERSQLVVMNIPPGDEVGEEVHEHTEQTLFFLSGSARVVLDGKESRVQGGDVVVVTPGTRHNFINDGREPLRIYTVYAPPNHIDGRVHRTHQDADADLEDEEFGQHPPER